MKEKIIAGAGLGFTVVGLALSLMYLVTEFLIPGLIPYSIGLGFLMLCIQQKKYHEAPLWITIILLSVSVAAFITGTAQIVVYCLL